MIRRPATILALLTGLNLFNYLDRYVLSAVLPKVQEALGLSNFVGGTLATVFLVGYFATSPAFGALADRSAEGGRAGRAATSRKALMAMGVAVWSAATFASGLVGSAAALLVARAVVGVGEASYATIAPTIIDDMAPPDRKGRWLSIFYSAMLVGSAFGYGVGGFVGKHWGWRHAFFAAGGPGLLLAALCLFVVEPSRARDAAPRAIAPPERVDWIRSVRALARIADYRRGVLGYCAQTFAVGGFAYWAPTYLYRRFGLDLAGANVKFALVTLVAGGLGTVLGGEWADRRLRRTGRADDATATSINLRVCAISGAIAAPFAAGCFLSPSAPLFFVCAFGCELSLFLSMSPINAVVLRSVPPGVRASAMAVSIFSIHALGDLWSPPLLGALQDAMPIAPAMMAVPVAIALSAAIWWKRGAAPSTARAS